MPSVFDIKIDGLVTASRTVRCMSSRWLEGSNTGGILSWRSWRRIGAIHEDAVVGGECLVLVWCLT